MSVALLWLFGAIPEAGGASTLSSERGSAYALQTGVVYVCLFMHNEDPHHKDYPDFSLPENQDAYLESRENLVDFCQMIRRNNIPFNWQSDWNFLSGVARWDTGTVPDTTAGKNVVRYISEDLGITVDPHSHENNGFNYADVAYLIDFLGVTPSETIGGHIWDPYDRNFVSWARFANPLPGSIYPGYSWKGSILMGQGTTKHVNDPIVSGIWKPKGVYQYWTHDEAGQVIVVGDYEGSVEGIGELTELYTDGRVAPEEMLTSTIYVGQHQLTSEYIDTYESSVVKPLIKLENAGKIKIVTFGELISDWETIYQSAPYIYNAPPSLIARDNSGDYDGDGTDDIAVFRKYYGLWAVRGITRFYFGSEVDLPIPGDYNGDGITEGGIFRARAGLWAVRGVTRIYFGSSSDTVVPGDYDGDGSTDIAVFYDSSGRWAVKEFTRCYFGTLSDLPVSGDYNGDGTTDIAIFRPGSGLWAVQGVSRVYFGSQRNWPAPADYNGDGTWEPAIFEDSSGLWAIRGVTRAYYGKESDQPIPADYDGDSTCDPGIFRSSSGLWAVSEISRAYFGASEDMPVTR